MTELSRFFHQLAEAPSSVLLLDYDGTLAPFHLDRNRAYPYPEVLPILEGIVHTGKTRVVVITGRPVVELKTLLGPLSNLEIWGSHGLEQIRPDGTYRQIHVDQEVVEALLRARAWAAEAGLVSNAEFKPGGIAIHWRGKPKAEVDRIKARALEAWAALAERGGLKLLDFDGGIELRVARPHKGDAVAAILQDSESEAPAAYLGDDLTDEDAFAVLNGRGLTVLVRNEHRKTQATVWLKPPEELISFLIQWLRSVSN